MKIGKKALFLVLIIVGCLSITSILAVSTDTYDIQITSYFDESEIHNTVTDATFGSSLSIEGNLSTPSGFEFGYYVVDGIVKETLDVEYNFIVTSNMDIKVIFTPITKHIVLFQDSNGVLLDMKYVEHGATVSDSEVPLPNKEGMVITSEKWDGVLTSITSNTVLTLQYEIDPGIAFEYIIGDGTYNYNQEVTVTAPLLNNGKVFSHFEEDGQIIGRQNSLSITLFENRTITAVYTGEMVSNAPFVSISNDLEMNEGYSSFIGHYYIPEEFTIVEVGMISYTNSEFDLDTTGIVTHTIDIETLENSKYPMEFNQAMYTFVRGYVTFKDSTDTQFSIYSNTKACGDIIEDTLIYETGIEDDGKGTYASGIVTLSGNDWSFNDALIGTIPNDQKMDYKSVRLRNGQIETKFTVSNLSKISFNQGTYGADSVTDFDLEISTDGITWHTVDSDISSDTDFTVPYEFSFTQTVFSTLGLNSEDAYYIRIQHVGHDSNRINIDDINIYSGIVNNDADPTTLTSLQTNTMVLEVSGIENTIYTVGDSFTGTCIALDMIDGNVECTSSGYNMNIPGKYIVTFTAIDYEGITHTASVSIIVEEQEAVISLEEYLLVDYIGYYDGIEGLYGEDLMNALRDIIQEGFVPNTYDDAREALGYIDSDPDVEGNILLIYNRASIDSTWDSGVTWNREHVWPNSRLGVERVDGGDRSIASDFHNLRACDTGVNSARNNDIYTDFSDGTWFPGVEDKGDVARILFYMATMYPQLTLTDEATSKNIDGIGYTDAGALMGDLEDLLAWNLIDDTDIFETTRNDRIEEYQNNRNPFIDYPYLAELIWHYEESN
jgi:endonuclease I